MASAARVAAFPPETRKAGAPTPASTDYFSSNAVEDNVIAFAPQPGRIIRLHWLRDDEGEEAQR